MTTNITSRRLPFRVFLLTLALLAACESNRRPSAHAERVAAACTFTDRYSHSALSRWNVRGHAAGADCEILVVETSIVMEDAMVEALHYGVGAYDIYQGGIRQFSTDHAFHGVVYRDVTRKEWPYGETGAVRVAMLEPCG